MNLSECVDHIRVVPMIGPPADIFDCFDRGHERRSVQAGTRDGVKKVSHRQESGSEREDFTLYAGGGSAATPTLLGGGPYPSHLRKRRKPGGQFLAHLR